MATNYPGAGTVYRQNYPPPSPGSVPVGAPKLPATLRVAFYAVLAMAVCAITGATLIFATGKNFINQAGADYLDAHSAGVIGHDARVEAAYNLLVNRAIADLVSVAIILLLAIFARKGATWARVLVTVFLLLGIPARLLEVLGAPIGYQATVVVTVLISLLVPVLYFLPPSNRFNKARKAARR